MRKRRAHTRTHSDPDDVGQTTDTDQTGAWHSLDLETQARLEHAAIGPDVTRTSFLLSIGVAGVSYLRLALLHVHAHRWRT